MSARELARQLGVQEKSLRRWRARIAAGELPTPPADDDVSGWAEYLAKNGLGRGESDPDITELRAEKLAVEIRLLELKEQQARRELVTVDDVRAYLATLGAKLDQYLTQKIETELPVRLLGKDIVSARSEARAIHDEIRAEVNKGISQWSPPKQ